MVRELLLGRLDGLSAPQVAAFLDGWCSALELVRRTDVWAPDAPGRVQTTIEELVATIERAQAALLEEDDA